MDDLAVEVAQNFFLHLGINAAVEIVSIERCDLATGEILLSEGGELRAIACRCAVECALDGRDASLCIVFHVVGKKHQLGDVDKAPKTTIAEPLPVHALALGNHPATVVRLFHLNERKREAVDEQSDVRSELIEAIGARELPRTVKDVLLGMVEVYKSDRRNVREPLIEASPEVVVVKLLADLNERFLRLPGTLRVEAGKHLFEHIGENVGVWVVENASILFFDLAAIIIPQPREMDKCRHLHTG